MKKIAIVLAISLAAASLLAAQPFGTRPMMGQGYGYQQAAPEIKSIEGKLAFVDTYPAVQTKDKTYILRMPRFFYTAYTDGIKEGAQLKLEGYELPAFPGQDKPYFAVTKATINGKVYDIAAQAYGRRGMMQGFGGAQNFGGRGGMMGGRGGRW